MPNETNYIDDYFNNKLEPEDKIVFEQRCLSDESFAEDVAIYIASRDAVKQAADEERKKRWRNLQQEETTNKPAKVVNIKRWVMVAAAACVAALIFLVWPTKQHSLKAEADKYIEQNLQTIGVSMGSGEDSLQQAVNLYNDKQYEKAIDILNGLLAKSANDVYALQYRGLSYLMLKNYNAAISDFETLAGYSELATNPGLFYKALTLLERNQPDDAASAGTLLQNIVEEKKEGWKEAEKWLK